MLYLLCHRFLWFHGQKLVWQLHCSFFVVFEFLFLMHWWSFSLFLQVRCTSSTRLQVVTLPSSQVPHHSSSMACSTLVRLGTIFKLSDEMPFHASFITFPFSLQDTALNQEPLSPAPHSLHSSSSSNSFRTTHPPPPRLLHLLQPLLLLQLRASRVASSSLIHLRQPSSTHQEPSLPKTIPPRPHSPPTTACRRAPSPAQGTSPALGSPHLLAAPLHQELLTHMPATGPLMVRATLSQGLDTGKRGLLLILHTLNPFPIMLLQLFGVGAGNFSSVSPLVQISNPNMKQETPPVWWLVFVCRLSNTLLCSGPAVYSLYYFLCHCQLCPLVSVIVTRLYAHTWTTKTGCCTSCPLCLLLMVTLHLEVGSETSL